MLYCHITWSYISKLLNVHCKSMFLLKKKIMFIINVKFVCYLGFESDNILGKEKMHFVR